MTLADLLVQHGITHRIEIVPGQDVRYVVTAPFVAEDVARALVRAAANEDAALTFQHVHRTVTAGLPPAYRN